MSDTGLTPVMNDADEAAARELSLRGTRPPVAVPGYDREQFLGHGAYGEVWTAVNRNSGRRVAIKFFTRRGALDWSALAREVEKLRYLFSNRSVVQLFEVGWESDPPYYVMEFMENGSLEDRLRTSLPPVEDAVRLFREVAVGLVQAHDKGILHCDLKPANILLDHDRRPRLADFGQSRLTNETAPALGTLFYMAPEQADLTATPDARWDVYALGAVLYRMLTGEPPHRNDTSITEVTSGGSLEAQLTAYRKLILSAPKPSAHREVPGVDAGLAAIVDKCLEPSAAKRFPNPQAVLTALDAWQLRRARRPLLWLTGLTFALLFVLMALVGQYLFRTTVSTAASGVEGRTLEANRFAAQTEARQFAAQIQLRWVQLEAAARNTQIRELLARGDGLKADPAAGLKLDALLAERKERGDRQFAESDKSSLWFATDASGHQRGSAPTVETGRHAYRGYRDYFHGLGERPAGAGPPPGMISRPHRSVAYLRERPTGERMWSVAFTVPVLSDGPDSKPVGIVGMTIDLADARAESDDHFAVLVDTHPDKTGRRGLILRHPCWAGMKGDPEPDLYYADEIVAWADSFADGATPFAVGSYTDPAAAGNGRFGGAWLAAAYRVRVGPEKVDTGWVVVVQERRDEALRPVSDLKWRLGYVGLAAAVIVLGLVALMWGGVVALMDGTPRSPVARFLRTWAGLPSGGSSLPANGTARDAATSGPTPTPGA